MSQSTNIHHQRTSFHGRQELLGLIGDVVGSGRRLITVLGPPGVGKTRLAQRYVELISTTESDTFPGGLWLVDLTEAHSPDDLLTLTAKALSVPVSTDQSVSAAEPDRVGWAIAGRGPTLIVLDNFEHLVSSCRELLDRWLSQAPEAVFVVTSRHRLHLRDEVLVEVGPMDVPSPDHGDAASLSTVESVALFLDRARLVRPSWQTADQDLFVVGDIVRRLDGLPLAIELAAARMDVLNPAEVDRRLDQRFRLLRRVSEVGDDRRASLTASIQWSWDQLEDWESSALRQLTVFKGGFTASSAEAVIDVAAFDGAPGVLDILRSLKAKSLLSTAGVESRSAPMRFVLLESIRAYAVDQLEDEDEARRAYERHAAYFARKGLEWAQAILFVGDPEAARLVAEERANLQAVFSRCVTGREAASRAERDGRGTRVELRVPVPQVLSVALALAPIFHPSVPLGTYEGIVEPVREVLLGELPGAEAVLTMLQYAVAEVYRLLEGVERSEQMFRLALRSAKRSGEGRLEGLAMLGIARIQWEGMSCEESIDTTERALTRLDESREPALVVAGLRNIAMARSYRWKLREAIPLWEKALSTASAWGVRNEELRILVFFGRDLWMSKDFARLKSCAARALQVSEIVGDPWLEANRLMSFAYLLSKPGNDDSDLVRALTFFKGFGSHLSTTNGALVCGFFWLDKGQKDLAKQYLDQAREELERFSAPIWLEAECLSLEALIQWEEGNLEQAGRLLAAAVESSRKSGHVIFEVVWLSQLAALQTLRKHHDEAEQCFDAARAILDDYDLPTLADLYTVHAGFRDVHLAREAHVRGQQEEADRHRARVRNRLVEVLGPWPFGEDTSWHPDTSAYYSPDIRLAARKLELALDPADQRLLLLQRLDPEQSTLVVEAAGRWFLVPREGERDVVDLSSRPKLCVLLSSLAKAWRPAPSAPSAEPPKVLSPKDIAAAVWPGEKLIPRSMRARVQVAISTLRKMGLRDYLLRERGGYYLDPAKPVSVLAGEFPRSPHLQPG